MVAVEGESEEEAEAAGFTSKIFGGGGRFIVVLDDRASFFVCFFSIVLYFSFSSQR